MKRFMYFSVSVLCLAFAALIGFYIGSHQVEAQVQDPISGYCVLSDGTYIYHFTMLSNGDTYIRHSTIYWNNPIEFLHPEPKYYGNFWEGAVSTDKSSWGDIKGQFNNN